MVKFIGLHYIVKTRFHIQSVKHIFNFKKQIFMVKFVSYIELVRKEILLKVFFKVLTGGTFVLVSPFADLEIEIFTDE